MQGVILGSKIRHSAARRRWAGQSCSEVLTSPVGTIRNHKQHAGYTCLGADTNHCRPWVRARLLPNSTFAVPHMSNKHRQTEHKQNEFQGPSDDGLHQETPGVTDWSSLCGPAPATYSLRKASETHRKQGCECPHLGLRALSIHPMSLKTRPLSDAGRDDRRASGPHKKTADFFRRGSSGSCRLPL